MCICSEKINIHAIYFDKYVSVLWQTGGKQNSMKYLFCCFLGNPANWFLWPCVFRGLRQCEPVWHRAGYPGCKPDIRHSAEPDSGAGYSRLASGSTFEIFLQSVMLQKHSLYLNSNRKKYLAIPFFFPVIYFINIRFYNVMNYVVLLSCDKL